MASPAKGKTISQKIQFISKNNTKIAWFRKFLLLSNIIPKSSDRPNPENKIRFSPWCFYALLKIKSKVRKVRWDWFSFPMMNSVESGENPCSELVIPHYESHALFHVCTKACSRRSGARGQPDSRTSCTHLFIGISTLKLKPQKKSYCLFGLFEFSAQRRNPCHFVILCFIFTFFQIPTLEKSEKILPERVCPLSRPRPFESYSFPTITDWGTNQIDNPWFDHVEEFLGTRRGNLSEIVC